MKARLLIALHLLGVGPSIANALTAQCLEGYKLELAPGSALTVPSSGRDVILIHGYELNDLAGWPSDALMCSQVTARKPGEDYFHTSDPDSGARWTPLVRELNRRGVRVWTWRWPTYLSIVPAGDMLRNAVESEGPLIAGKLILVGHSMGGLVALQALTGGNPLRDRVVRIVTLGTPHAGTEATYFNLLSAAARDVTPNSDYLADLRSRRLTQDAALTFTLGGNTTASCLVDIYPEFPLQVLHDCVVSVLSAYDNYNQYPLANSPLRIVSPTGVNSYQLPSGHYNGYNHRHMALDYRSRRPRDITQGRDLNCKVRELVHPTGDIKSDCRVDVIDLGILLSAWRKTDRPPADLNQGLNQDPNQSPVVDVQDLGILLSNWGVQSEA